MDQNERPRYYEGQYLGADDLAGAIGYGRVQAARHVLGAHTWGIAVGLDLVERPLPSGSVQVTIAPGLAWDGYGRSLVVTAPTPLGPDQFSNFQGTTPADGRLVKVWLRYDETALGGPAAGFATCRVGDPSRRIAEGCALELGEPPSGPHGSLTIAGSAIDTFDARAAFAPGAPRVYDESVPYQTFPDGTLPQWWIPLGYVRWQQLAGQPGRLIARNDQGSPPDSDLIRALRRYVGLVADTIGAADGVIRLRDRWSDPDPAKTHFQTPRATLDKQHPPVNDLVWIEGHLRVMGDVRAAGGRIDLRDATGSDAKVPLALRRAESNARGGKDLQIVLGAETTPTGTHAFVIGPAKLDPATGNLTDLIPRFVVRDDGNVEVNGSVTVSGAKFFRIPHPRAPAERDLVHACLEGPEAGVYYRGEAQLVEGCAVIELPGYFETLTRPDARSVLVTPIWDGVGPVSALAASPVRDGRFSVRAILGDNPSQRFWWEVKAVRADFPRLVAEQTRDGKDPRAAGAGEATAPRGVGKP